MKIAELKIFSLDTWCKLNLYKLFRRHSKRLFDFVFGIQFTSCGHIVTARHALIEIFQIEWLRVLKTFKSHFSCQRFISRIILNNCSFLVCYFRVWCVIIILQCPQCLSMMMEFGSWQLLKNRWRFVKEPIFWNYLLSICLQRLLFRLQKWIFDLWI